MVDGVNPWATDPDGPAHGSIQTQAGVANGDQVVITVTAHEHSHGDTTMKAHACELFMQWPRGLNLIDPRGVSKLGLSDW